MGAQELPLLPPMSGTALVRALLKRPAQGRVSSFGTQFALPGIARAGLERYNRLMGFGPGAFPVSYYYLIAQRAHLPTLLKPEFPFRVMGLVHVANDIVEHAMPEPERVLRVATQVRIEPPRENGAVYCHLETVGSDGPLRVFTSTSTYLVVRGKARERSEQPQARPAAPVGTWQLNRASGREYAALSGDWNPIHLWGWSARLLGMREPIIHGMHTMGKACALLEQASGRRVTAISGRFRKPVPLGARLDLHARLDEGSYVVVTEAGVALEGHCRFTS